MDTDALTPGILRGLRATRPYPVLSLTMPTHRREPDNAQDPVRLRNLLAEAQRRIDADPQVSRQQRISLQEQLARAAAEIDLVHALDGLVVFATTEEHQIWTLPRSVPERVVLSDSFLTRNLVAAQAQARPYWILAVAADQATLWSGTGDLLRQHEGDGFPAAPDPAQWDVQHQERTGGQPSAFSDEDTRHFLRAADAALAALQARDPRPLFLVGLPEALTLLKEVGTAATAAPAGTVPKGGLTRGPAQALLAETARARAEETGREQERVRGALDAAQSRKQFAAGLDEVWELVREGRADLVAVEEHFQRTVRLTDGHLTPAEPEPAGGWEEGVREDIVDELVETALGTGTEVRFLPDGLLSGHDGVAAALRY
jgi:hypothetical protein